MPISKPNGLFELQLVIIYISVILKPTKRKIRIYNENYLKNPRLFFKAYLLHTPPLYSM